MSTVQSFKRRANAEKDGEGLLVIAESKSRRQSLQRTRRESLNVARGAALKLPTTAPNIRLLAHSLTGELMVSDCGLHTLQKHRKSASLADGPAADRFAKENTENRSSRMSNEHELPVNSRTTAPFQERGLANGNAPPTANTKQYKKRFGKSAGEPQSIKLEYSAVSASCNNFEKSSRLHHSPHTASRRRTVRAEPLSIRRAPVAPQTAIPCVSAQESESNAHVAADIITPGVGLILNECHINVCKASTLVSEATARLVRPQADAAEMQSPPVPVAAALPLDDYSSTACSDCISSERMSLFPAAVCGSPVVQKSVVTGIREVVGRALLEGNFRAVPLGFRREFGSITFIIRLEVEFHHSLQLYFSLIRLRADIFTT